MPNKQGLTTVKLPSGETVPALGQGTWQMADHASTRADEIAALRLGIEMGATLIDTAEMYGEGRAEELVAEAIEGQRDRVFLVSKVYPHNASRAGTLAACERSLKRLKTDRLDLYLLHWRGSIPLSETIEGFMDLHHAGKIRYYGVSNFDLADMQELWSVPGGSATATNQVLYNLTRRSIEHELLPWLRDKGVPLMAYSPLEKGKLIHDQKLNEFGKRHGLTAAQVAIGWLLAQPQVIVIPKSGSPERLKQNLKVWESPLSREQLSELDKLFPAPKERRPLEMI